jgi:DNA-binding PadR family transcriptional regulator
MYYEKALKLIEGTRTLEDVQEKLKIDRTRAIYLLHRLRKLGFIRTRYSLRRKRLYSISPLNKQEGTSYLEAFNRDMPNASLRMNDEENEFVHGRKLKAEDELIYALKKHDIRYVISSLFLFRKIEDWPRLYRLAKKENLTRQISALYEISRIFVRKVRRMPERFRKFTIPKKNEKYVSIVDGFDSEDFKDIEKRWKVYIPLNRADLQEYKYILLKHDKHK